MLHPLLFNANIAVPFTRGLIEHAQTTPIYDFLFKMVEGEAGGTGRESD